MMDLRVYAIDLVSSVLDCYNLKIRLLGFE